MCPSEMIELFVEISIWSVIVNIVLNNKQLRNEEINFEHLIFSYLWFIDRFGTGIIEFEFGIWKL